MIDRLNRPEDELPRSSRVYAFLIGGVMVLGPLLVVLAIIFRR